MIIEASVGVSLRSPRGYLTSHGDGGHLRAKAGCRQVPFPIFAATRFQPCRAGY